MNTHMVWRGGMIMICWTEMVTRKEFSKVLKMEIGGGTGLMGIVVI